MNYDVIVLFSNDTKMKKTRVRSLTLGFARRRRVTPRHDGKKKKKTAMVLRKEFKCLDDARRLEVSSKIYPKLKKQLIRDLKSAISHGTRSARVD